MAADQNWYVCSESFFPGRCIGTTSIRSFASEVGSDKDESVGGVFMAVRVDWDFLAEGLSRDRSWRYCRRVPRIGSALTTPESPESPSDVRIRRPKLVIELEEDEVDSAGHGVSDVGRDDDQPIQSLHLKFQDLLTSMQAASSGQQVALQLT